MHAIKLFIKTSLDTTTVFYQDQVPSLKITVDRERIKSQCDRNIENQKVA
jgi:hypothetical protein